VPTALADPPAATAEQQSPPGAPVPNGASAPASPEHAARACANCGAALRDGQDWCLQCGTGAPGGLRSRSPGWRSAAVLIAALALLVAGAAGAAYAALNKHSPGRRVLITAVAQAPAASATTPVPPATSTPTPTATAKVGAPTTIKPALPLGKSKPPKIPLSASTPKTLTTPTTPSGGATTPASKLPAGTTKQTPVPAGEAHPEAIELDTNAASTYNPYGYSAANFGDPSLTIDGDDTTGWTALVEPAAAPKMAVGLAIDLNAPRRLSALALTSGTPGMTVQIYGSVGQAPPTSITDPAWVALTPSLVASKRHERIQLGGTPSTAQAAKRAYRFVVLWISQAPASAVGTPQAPGHVSVNEVELFARHSK
jgi:hypothetical protein